MASFESFPHNGPDLAIGESTMYPSDDILKELDFVYPFTGTEAGEFNGKVAYFWVANFNQAGEAGVIVTYTTKDNPDAEPTYYYGVVRRDDLEGAADPVEFVLDAAMYHEPGDEGQVFALYQTALKLRGIVVGAPQPH